MFRDANMVGVASNAMSAISRTGHIFSFFYTRSYRKSYRELSPLALIPHLAMIAI
jgi:hypothetical protein